VKRKKKAVARTGGRAVSKGSPRPRTAREIRQDQFVVAVQRYLHHPGVSRRPPDKQGVVTVAEWQALSDSEREKWDAWWLQELVDLLLLGLLRGEPTKIVHGKDGRPSKLAAEKVGCILRLHLEGCGFEDIARKLNDENIDAKDVERVTKRAHTFDAASGAALFAELFEKKKAPG
jgi:hypothetical protein